MKVLFWVGVSLLLASPGAQAQESLWHEFFDAGGESYRQGNFSQAEIQFSSALGYAQRADNAEAATIKTIRRLTETFLAEQKFDQASTLLTKLLTLEEKAADKAACCGDYRTLARIASQQGKQLEADGYRQKATKLAREIGDSATLSKLLIEQAVGDEKKQSFSGVEPLLLEALRLREKNQRPDDLEVIAAVEQLADFYTSQSRLAEAEPLYKRSISGLENLKRAKDSSLVKDLLSLGTVYKEQGKAGSAEQTFKRAQSLSEKQFGLASPETANALICLGRLYTINSMPSRAISLFERAAAIRASAYSESDNRVADVLVLIGDAQLEKDDYLRAQKSFDSALSIDVKNQAESLAVARDLSSIGKLQLSQGKYDQANESYQRALAITIKVCGADSAETATAMNNLALLKRNQNDYVDAEALLQKALAIREKALGNNHAIVAQNLVNLADVLAAERRPALAEPLLVRALTIESGLFGAEHDNVTLIVRDLIDVLSAQPGKGSQAERYARKLLDRDERIAGSGSLLVVQDQDRLANILKTEANTPISALITAPTSSQISSQIGDWFESEGIHEKWALVVGISTFQDPNLNLKYAAKDATDFRDFLIQEANFKADHVKLITDDKATRENIVALLGDSWLKRVAKRDDMTVIYISSHGTQATSEAGGTNFIVPYEGNVQNIVFSGIPMQWLLAGLKNLVSSEHTCVFLDVCHAGAAANERKIMSNQKNSNLEDSVLEDSVLEGQKGIFRPVDINSQSLPSGAGQQVIAASKADQISWESRRYANGVFTHNLIKGLKIDGEHTTIGRAFDYLRSSVEEEVFRDRTQLQTPVIRPRSVQGAKTQMCVKTQAN